jgi:hypothetical protein
MAMTHELGARPWQQPPQYATVEEAMDYYIPRMGSDEFSDQLIDVMEMGIPLTTLANSIQMSGVMDGKHSIDVGLMVMPVLIEMMRLIGDEANVKYVTGMEEENKEPRSSLITKSLQKLREEEAKQDGETEEPEVKAAPAEEPEETEAPMGLMSRRS